MKSLFVRCEGLLLLFEVMCRCFGWVVVVCIRFIIWWMFRFCVMIGFMISISGIVVIRLMGVKFFIVL